MKSINKWIKYYNENEIPLASLIKEIQDESYLQALKDIQFRFSLLSDISAKCQGYANLLETIKKLEDV